LQTPRRPEGEKTEQQKEKSMTMTKAQALKTLVQYNNWRRNNDEDLIIDMPPPKLIGQALDFAIAELLNKHEDSKKMTKHTHTPELFLSQRFDTHGEWVDKASTFLRSHPDYDEHFRALCFDALGRICRNGGDFKKAKDQQTFPVYWVWPDQNLFDAVCSIKEHHKNYYIQAAMLSALKEVAQSLEDVADVPQSVYDAIKLAEGK